MRLRRLWTVGSGVRVAREVECEGGVRVAFFESSGWEGNSVAGVMWTMECAGALNSPTTVHPLSFSINNDLLFWRGMHADKCQIFLMSLASWSSRVFNLAESGLAPFA